MLAEEPPRALSAAVLKHPRRVFRYVSPCATPSGGGAFNKDRIATAALGEQLAIHSIYKSEIGKKGRQGSKALTQCSHADQRASLSSTRRPTAQVVIPGWESLLAQEAPGCQLTPFSRAAPNIKKTAFSTKKMSPKLLMLRTCTTPCRTSELRNFKKSGLHRI